MRVCLPLCVILFLSCSRMYQTSFHILHYVVVGVLVTVDRCVVSPSSVSVISIRLINIFLWDKMHQEPLKRTKHHIRKSHTHTFRIIAKVIKAIRAAKESGTKNII